MEDETKIEIVNQLSKWCDHCKLYAVQFYIWNNEAEQLETIISEALDTLPGKVGTEEWPRSLRASLGSLPHCWLRDLRLQIDFLLESPCKTEICQEECTKASNEGK